MYLLRCLYDSRLVALGVTRRALVKDYWMIPDLLAKAYKLELLWLLTRERIPIPKSFAFLLLIHFLSVVSVFFTIFHTCVWNLFVKKNTSCTVDSGAEVFLSTLLVA